MSYLVKVPDAMVEAKNYIENDNLLEAHKRYVFFFSLVFTGLFYVDFTSLLS